MYKKVDTLILRNDGMKFAEQRNFIIYINVVN